MPAVQLNDVSHVNTQLLPSLQDTLLQELQVLSQQELHQLTQHQSQRSTQQHHGLFQHVHQSTIHATTTKVTNETTVTAGHQMLVLTVNASETEKLDVLRPSALS